STAAPASKRSIAAWGIAAASRSCTSTTRRRPLFGSGLSIGLSRYLCLSLSCPSAAERQTKALHPLRPVRPQVEPQGRPPHLLVALVVNARRKNRHRVERSETVPLLLAAQLVATAVVADEPHAVRQTLLVEQAERQRTLE